MVCDNLIRDGGWIMQNKRMIQKFSFFVVIAMVFVIASTGITATNQDSPVFVGWESISGEPYPKNENDNISRTNEESISPDFVVDSKGNIHVVWSEEIDGENYDIFYVWNDGENWLTVDGAPYDSKNGNITNNPGLSINPQILLDSKDIPHIAWMDDSYSYYGDIFCVKASEKRLLNVEDVVWDAEKGNAKIARIKNDLNYYRFSIDLTDNLHFFWTEVVDQVRSEIFYSKWDGLSWKSIDGQELDRYNKNKAIFGVDFRNLFFDFDMFEGNPYLVWLGTGKDDASIICLIRWTGLFWGNIEREKSDSDFSNCVLIKLNYFPEWIPQIRIDSSGCAHIVWHQFEWGSVNPPIVSYIKWDGDGWITADGSRFNPDEANSWIDIDGIKGKVLYQFLLQDDEPVLIWSNALREPFDLFFTKLEEGDWVNMFGSEFDPFDSRIHFGASGSQTTYPEVKIFENGEIFFIRSDYSYENPEVILTKVSDGQEYLLSGEVYDSEAGNINITRCDDFFYEDFSFEMCAEAAYLVWNDFNCPNFVKWDGFNWVNSDGEKWDNRAWNANLTSYDESYSWNPTVATGNDGNPHIMWFEKSIGDDYSETFLLHYIRWHDDFWVNVYGEKWGNRNSALPDFWEYSWNFSFDIDANNLPHILWLDDGFINYIRFDGDKWLITNGDEYGLKYGDEAIMDDVSSRANNLDLTIDKNNCIHASWDDLNNNTRSKKYYLQRKADDHFWNTLTGEVFDIDADNSCVIEGIKSDLSIEVDYDNFGNPHFCWTDFDEGVVYLKYCYWDGEVFKDVSGEKVDLKSNDYVFISSLIIEDEYDEWYISPSLVLDSNGIPHVAWKQTVDVKNWRGVNTFINTDTFYSRWDGTAWVNLFGEQLEYEAKNAKITNSPTGADIKKWEIGLSGWDDQVQIGLSSEDIPYILWSDSCYSFGSSDILGLKGVLKKIDK